MSVPRDVQIQECEREISRHMERIGMHRDIWQNDAVWWLCKAMLLLLRRVK